MTMSESISTCFSKFATFKGRASRSEFWWFFLFQQLLWLIIQINFSLYVIRDPDMELSVVISNLILGVILAIPLLSGAARRLHDVGKSGWSQLLALTIIGLIPLVMWLARKGSTEANQYGEPRPESFSE